MEQGLAQRTSKRKFMGHNKNSKGNNKKLKSSDFKKPKKMDPKFKKMLMKKARDYNSGSDDDNDKHYNSERSDSGFQKRSQKSDRDVKFEKKRFKNDGRGNGKEEVGFEKRSYKNDRQGSERANVGFVKKSFQNDRRDNERVDMGFESKSYKNDHEFYAEKEEKEESFDDDDVEEGEKEVVSEDEDENGEILPGVTRFTEGCKAFSVAFRKIIKKAASEDVLGPVLSAHKKLVAEKLAEEDVDRKSKSEAKKEKLVISERGHKKPDKFLDAHEKFLISVATKGVVKLFNAVNKAQHAQKGLNPLRGKDEKVLKKRRKEAFFSELGRNSSSKGDEVGTSTEGERPGWAPLRDDFMLTSSKLKDWDKKDTTNEDESRMQSERDFSSDDD